MQLKNTTELRADASDIIHESTSPIKKPILAVPLKQAHEMEQASMISDGVDSILKVNGTVSKPQTTSQNKPPKIKLLNRSSNIENPLTEVNGIDDEEEPLNEDHDTDSGIANEANDVDGVLECLADINLDKELDYPSKNGSTPPRSTESFQRNLSSQYSAEYSSSLSSTASSLNRDNSLDYKDSTGVNLHEFMVKTLKENPRDRLMLLKLEKDFTEFISNAQKISYKYEQMTSYHRMLVHRVAAYFGLDHNVDSSGKAVVISKTPSSRAPETRFQSYCSREYTDEEIAAAPKAILIRASSLDDQGLENQGSSYDYGDHRFSLEDKKSFKEREEDYIKAKDRIFKDEEECDATDQSENTVPSTNRSSDSGQTMSEKEAAIAAVAARTGGKLGGAGSVKRTDRKNIGDLHLQNQTSFLSQENYGSDNMNTHYTYPGGNYQTGVAHIVRGQAVTPSDSAQVYYPPGYHPAASVAYLPSGAYGQQNQGSYMPLYYVNGVPSVSPLNMGGSGNTQHNLASQQQYYVQQTPSGPLLYIPRQSTSNDSQMLSSHQPQQQHQQQQQQQQQIFNYQPDYTNQMSNISLEDHTRQQQQTQQQQPQQHKPQNDVDKQPQVTSPASPTDISPTPVTVYYSGGQQLPHPNPQQYMSGYHVPVYHSGTYQSPYQDATQFTPNSSQPATPTGVHPPPSPTAVMFPRPYTPRNPLQCPILQQSPHQHLQNQILPQQMTSQRQRLVPQKVLPYREGNKVYLPVATGTSNPNQMAMTMLVRSPQQEVMLQNYTANKSTMNIGTTALPVAGSTIAETSAVEYVKGDVQTYAIQQQEQQIQQQQSIIQLSQQQRPLMHFQPVYQQAYYMSQTKKFIPRPMTQNHFIRPNNTIRKYRPPRHMTGNQQIRISRPNSHALEQDQNTVGHILEVYDFPDSVVSDNDVIFDDVRSSGARILKINSSPQSNSSPHAQQQGSIATQRPTILAIFKSSCEAQSALENVRSSYYKLRVSKKSPTHLSGSDYHPSGSSSNHAHVTKTS